MTHHLLAAAARTLGYTAADLPGTVVDADEWARWRQVADKADVDLPDWAGRCEVRDQLKKQTADV